MTSAHLAWGTTGHRQEMLMLTLTLFFIALTGVVIYLDVTRGADDDFPHSPAIAYVGEHGIAEPDTFKLQSENGRYSLDYEPSGSTFGIHRHVETGKRLVSVRRAEHWYGKVMKLENDGTLTHYKK